MSRYIHHVTLTTGHVRQSWRHEIDPDVMPTVVRLLAEARAGDRPIMPGLTPETRLRWSSGSTRCGMGTLYALGVPVLTFGVALHSRCGAHLWRLMHDIDPPGELATSPDECPPEPWCAARIEPGIALIDPAHLPDLMGAIADLERCIAWAWLEASQ